MKDFVRVAAVSPNVKVADPFYNVEEMLKWAKEAEKEAVSLLVYPELSVSGYTANDLLLQESLQEACKKALKIFSVKTKKSPVLFVIGYPLVHKGKLFNTAVVMQGGMILGIVPKRHLPNHSEFYEERYFQEGREEVEWIQDFLEKDGDIPFGMHLHFIADHDERFRLAVEICEDLWVPNPPSVTHCLMGATVIANTTASDALIKKNDSRRALVQHSSGCLHNAYVYTSAGPSESTQDMVFSAHSMVAENGKILAESPRFYEGMTFGEIDLSVLWRERIKQNTFETVEENAVQVPFTLFKADYLAQGISVKQLDEVERKAGTRRGLTVEKAGAKEVESSKKEKRLILKRFINPMPFLPVDSSKDFERGEEILSIQAHGLKKRLQHIGAKKVILGLSGGLDSTLALFVAVKCFQLLGYDLKNIIAVTMPSFGTSEITHSNALESARILGTDMREIPIHDAVLQHFKDISYDESKRDVVYENAQARERTQILMDLANKEGALLIGTGDLSESALGFSTYNGDHMSMYSVNCDVPKTAIPLILHSFVKDLEDASKDKKEKKQVEELKKTVEKIIHVPVSPELMPPNEKGEIQQKTEEILGPYALHDFFLYMHLRYGFSAKKVFFLACHAFSKENLKYYSRDAEEIAYTPVQILNCLRIFYKRFFAQQFKRSCTPDGPKVGRIGLSPRGDLRQASDASSQIWLKELEEIESSL